MDVAAEQLLAVPDMTVSARQVFGIDSDLEVPAFSEPNEHVPDLDEDYLFNRENPKGIHHERWCHSYGCGQWFNLARSTVTHEILAVYKMGEKAPEWLE